MYLYVLSIIFICVLIFICVIYNNILLQIIDIIILLYMKDNHLEIFGKNYVP